MYLYLLAIRWSSLTNQPDSSRFVAFHHSNITLFLWSCTHRLHTLKHHGSLQMSVYEETDLLAHCLCDDQDVLDHCLGTKDFSMLLWTRSFFFFYQFYSSKYYHLVGKFNFFAIDLFQASSAHESDQTKFHMLYHTHLFNQYPMMQTSKPDWIPVYSKQKSSPFVHFCRLLVQTRVTENWRNCSNQIQLPIVQYIHGVCDSNHFNKSG